MAVHFTILRAGSDISAQPDSATPFDLAERVHFRRLKQHIDWVGLSNDAGHFGHATAAQYLYAAADYHATFGFMADFIEPTAICEGRSFLSLNTYDRAHFTFGFGQFAAHVPDGDFIRWFRDMVRRPEAIDYFPELQVKGGRIFKIGGPVPQQLEDSHSTDALMTYLNPSLNDLEDAEIVAAARLCHWTMHYPDTRLLQVQHMVEVAHGKMHDADIKLNLDGQGGDICCIVFDILHQGRGTYSEMRKALLAADPYAALLKVGSLSEPGRCHNLTEALKTHRPVLAAKKWSRAKQAFI